MQRPSMQALPVLAISVLAACEGIQLQEPAFDPEIHTWPYYEPELVEARASHARPVDTVALAMSLQELLEAEAPATGPVAADALRAAVIDGLNIGFLLDGFAGRPFTVREVGRLERGGLVWRRLVVADELVVDLTIDVLAPRAVGSVRPAVVELHGHFDDGVDMLQQYLGYHLATKGMVVVAPHFRHMGCGDQERDQSLLLLADGFTLMGYRVYETLLAAKVARSLAGVDPARVGLLAHSGGAAVAILVARVAPAGELAALVTDFEVDYRTTCDGDVHCETVPALFPLAGAINDPSTIAVPQLRATYAFPEPPERAEITDFLTEQLEP